MTNIMTVGEKIKKLRSEYKLNQDDIVGTELTRNLISQIEHGKANLTRSTAELIIRNTSDILKHRGIPIDKNLNVDYLLEDENEQAKKIINKYIRDLKDASFFKDNRFSELLKSVENMLVQWDFPELKIEICEIAGDYFTSKNEFYRASIYFENIRYLVNSKESLSKLIPALRKLSIVYYYMGRFKEGINVCKYALDRFADMEEEYKGIFMFNMALYYNDLGQYEKALKVLEDFQYAIKLTDKQKQNKVELLRASCLHATKHYAEALNINIHLLKSASKDDIKNMCLYYGNLAEGYIKLGQKYKAVDCAEQIKKLVGDVSGEWMFLPAIYFELGLLCRLLGDNPVYYLKKALDSAKSFKYEKGVCDTLIEFAKVDNKELPINLRDELVLLIEERNSIPPKVMTAIIEYYAKRRQDSIIIEICGFCNKKGVKEC
ncbi:helix-turn-helix domain-containing protein [Clostridium felsineum]|uniref:helix-turn-helix domain-containing protein n=1 Tax=Clostridium felsineum TaxID=36839 RepID=UPI00098C187D|nr:helix-turn-helix transcriptional regulator [Clostridium felsineum]URZ14917.1 hypothetical protein CLFE_009300 [Clostridium felsineum DSM 794]